MIYAGALLLACMFGLPVAFTILRGKRGLHCPRCEQDGQGVIEEARAHLGWATEHGDWLPRYWTRRHFRCRRCGHAWASER